MQGECKKASLLVFLPSRSHFYAKSVEMEVVYGLLSLPMNSSLSLTTDGTDKSCGSCGGGKTKTAKTPCG